MPLSSPTSRRALRRTRAIQFDAYACDDGLRGLGMPIFNIKHVLSGSNPAFVRRANYCMSHAARSDGEAIAECYARWAVKSLAESKSS